MSIFDQPTTVSESPQGQEEQTAGAGYQEEVYEDSDNEGEYTEEESYDDETYEEVDDQDEENEPSQEDNSLLAGKFKSTEDLATAYMNLQKAFTEKSTELSKMRQQQPQQQYEQEWQEDPNEIFRANFEQNPLGSLQYLVDTIVQQRTAPIYEARQQEQLNRNIQDLAKEYREIATEEGISKLTSKVNEIASELGNPQLAKNPTPRILKLAAAEAFGDSKAQLYQKAKQAGRQEAEEARRAKQGLAAQTSRKPQAQPKTPEDIVAESIVNAGRRGGLFG